MLPALIPLIGPTISKLIDLIPNKAEREKAKLQAELEIKNAENQLLTTLAEIDKAQIAVNQEEAKSSDLFVAGWRPACGWIATSGMLWAFVLKPIGDWILVASGSAVKPPEIASGELVALLLGMLGLGGLRTFERTKGIDRSNLKEY